VGEDALTQLRLQVHPGNVLRVRAALLAESDRLHAVLAAGPPDPVGACGGDPLSADARTAFNGRVRDVVAACRSYADELGAAGRSLELVARDYGFTDAQIADSYRGLADGSRPAEVAG
jgi:hypothetical protein